MSSLQSTPSSTSDQPVVIYRLTHTWWIWLCMIGIVAWNMFMVDEFPVNDVLFVWLSGNMLLWFCTGIALFAVMQAGFKYADQTARLKVARNLMLTLTVSCLLYWPVAYATDPQQSQASGPQQAQSRPIPVLPDVLPTTELPAPPIVETTVPTTTRQPTTSPMTTQTTTMPTTTTTTTPPSEEEPVPISIIEPEPLPDPEPEPDPVTQPDPQVNQDPQVVPDPPVVDEPVQDGVVAPPQ